MSANFAYSFTIDKDNNAVYIHKEFSAPCSLVWDAFTQPEILDMWGAPPPFTLKTKSMNFEVGGTRLYVMTSPDGHEQWSIQEFTAIKPISNFKMLTNFSDSEGNIDTGFKSSENNIDFNEVNLVTTVQMSIKYASSAVLAMMIERGFKLGMKAAMENLENVLKNIITERER